MFVSYPTPFGCNPINSFTRSDITFLFSFRSWFKGLAFPFFENFDFVVFFYVTLHISCLFTVSAEVIALNKNIRMILKKHFIADFND